MFKQLLKDLSRLTLLCLQVYKKPINLPYCADNTKGPIQPASLYLKVLKDISCTLTQWILKLS